MQNAMRFIVGGIALYGVGGAYSNMSPILLCCWLDRWVALCLAADTPRQDKISQRVRRKAANFYLRCRA
jgi:hypothetical protein